MTDLAELDATAADVVLARLEALETAASALVESQVRPNTRRAFTADWASWCRFCAGEGIDPLTVSPGLLVAFATWLAHALPDRPAMSPATITRQLSGVLNGWRRAGLTVPRGITSEARKIIAGYQRNLRREDLPVGRGASPALTIRDLRRISATCPATLIGARNRAMLVLGFSIAARRSELAELLVSDIADDPNGLIVTIRDSKTGLRQPVVPPGTDELTCAVRTWHAWLKASGITSGRAFRNITRHGKLGDGITGKSINEIVTAAGKAAEIEVRLTGHSLRSGLATEARRAGHDAKTIAAQGGWKDNSAVLYGYMQIVDRWADNALKGIGL